MEENKKSPQVATTTSEERKIKGFTIELSSRDTQPIKTKKNWLKRLLENLARW